MHRVPGDRVGEAARLELVLQRPCPGTEQFSGHVPLSREGQRVRRSQHAASGECVVDLFGRRRPVRHQSESAGTHPVEEQTGVLEPGDVIVVERHEQHVHVGSVDELQAQRRQPVRELGHPLVGVAGQPEPQVVGEVGEQLGGLESHLRRDMARALGAVHELVGDIGRRTRRSPRPIHRRSSSNRVTRRRRRPATSARPACIRVRRARSRPGRRRGGSCMPAPLAIEVSVGDLAHRIDRPEVGRLGEGEHRTAATGGCRPSAWPRVSDRRCSTSMRKSCPPIPLHHRAAAQQRRRATLVDEDVGGAWQSTAPHGGHIADSDKAFAAVPLVTGNTRAVSCSKTSRTRRSSRR